MNAPVQENAYCYNNLAKQMQSKSARAFYRQAQKLLGDTFVWETHFNPGGIAVWGETHAHIWIKTDTMQCGPVPGKKQWYETNLKPAVEAYDTSMGILVRQWNGEHSGYNHYAQTLEQFIELVRELSAKPFVRF